MAFCTEMQIDHTLEDPEVPTVEVLQVFGVRVVTELSQTGCQGSGQTRLMRRGALSPRSTYWNVALTPVSPPGSSSRDLDKRLTRMLRHWG